MLQSYEPGTKGHATAKPEREHEHSNGLKLRLLRNIFRKDNNSYLDKISTPPVLAAAELRPDFRQPINRAYTQGNYMPVELGIQYPICR